MKATRDWDARTYSRVGTPMAQWGERLIDRLELRGDETVLDAGCGSGGVTAKLLDRLPQGRVIAVDGSPLDGRRRARGPARRPGADARCATSPARARRAGRRRVLERRVPLDLRPRPPVRGAARRAAARRAAGGPVRRRGQHRRPQGGDAGGRRARALRRAHRRLAALELRRADPDARPPAPGRLCPGALLAHRGTGRARGRRRLCRHGLPRLAPGPPARGASRRYVADVLRGAGEPFVLDYVRLNIDARA